MKDLIDQVAALENWVLSKNDPEDWCLWKFTDGRGVAAIDDALSGDGAMALLEKLLRAGWQFRHERDEGGERMFEIEDAWGTTVYAPSLEEAILRATIARHGK